MTHALIQYRPSVQAAWQVMGPISPHFHPVADFQSNNHRYNHEYTQKNCTEEAHEPCTPSGSLVCVIKCFKSSFRERCAQKCSAFSKACHIIYCFALLQCTGEKKLLMHRKWGRLPETEVMPQCVQPAAWADQMTAGSNTCIFHYTHWHSHTSPRSCSCL